MLLQAHSFIVFLHPNAAMQRQLIDLNPFHETDCQTAVVQEEARQHLCFTTKGFIRGECLGTVPLILKMLSECDKEKSKSNFKISFQESPLSISFNFSATNYKHGLASLFKCSYQSTLEYNQKQGCLTSYGTSQNT